jgi:hypothetical protein
MRRFKLAYAIGAMAVSSCSCNPKSTVIKVSEDFVLVPGSPAVNAVNPTVDDNPQASPSVYRINVTRQCDTFVQNAVRKVDILWVVDSSGSMAPHQQQLASNFSTFINYLMPQNPGPDFVPIDFHIGVVSTDTDDPGEQGRLHGFTQNGAVTATGSFIGCDSTRHCNVDGQASVGPAGAVQTAFTQMATVGTLGSQVERGLYASYLALNRDENKDASHDGSGFIRDDAALYIIVVSDEDDSSCSPNISYLASGNRACTNDPGCHCADDGALAFGTTDFYTRFFENYKGYGHGDLVALAGIVGDNQGTVPTQVPGDTTPHAGCTAFDPISTRTLIAYYGSRYAKVIDGTGGANASICSSNFNLLLNKLAFSVTGLKSDFKLTRGPDTSSLEVYVASANEGTSPACVTNNDCTTFAPYDSCQNQRCARKVAVSPSQDPNSSQYVRCENDVYRDIVRFGSDTIPNALNSIEVCYNVDPQFDQTCTP